jgi:hypothetical protein
MYLRRHACRPSPAERGQVVVVFALLIPVFFALGAVVMDIGNWYVHKRHLQTQVDAAAFAGAHEFFACGVEDPPVTANKSIRAHALEYAGDTLRPPSSIDPLLISTTAVRNTQVQEPADVRVVLNSAAFWTGGATDGSTYDNTLDPDSNPATNGEPCTTKMLDVKATDVEVTNLWGLIPLHPSPKTKARVEIRQIIEEKGMLPFAVPEVDPARVAALFVNEDTGVKVDQQYLCRGGPNTVFSYWTTCNGTESDAPDPPVPGNPNVDIPAENTSVIILVSKNDPNPNISLPLPNVCTQSPGLIRCHGGSGPTSGVNFIHGWSDIPGGYLTAAAPQIRDVTVLGCGADLSAPYFLANADCSVGVTAHIDFGFPSDPVPNRPTGIGASATLHASTNCGGSGDSLGYSGISGTETTWTGGSKTINAASGRNPLSIEIRWQPLPGSGFSKCFPLVAAPYAADDASGPIEYLDIEDVDQAPYPLSVDGNSRNSGGGHLVRVVVGMNKPIQLEDPLADPFLLRFASKSGSLNQALDCDAGIPFKDEIADGCQTRYRVNYYDWSTPPDGTYEWQDILCSAYPNPSDLPPPTFEPPLGSTAPNCVSAKTGDTTSMRQGLFERFHTNPDPGADNFCWPNNWPGIATDIPGWILNHGPLNDPRYITLVITDFTAFSGSGAENVPVKYIAGFYATGWDVGPAGPGGAQTGCSENDPHPLGLNATKDNGDVWGHFVNIVVPNPHGTPSEQLCNFDEVGTCIAVLVE